MRLNIDFKKYCSGSTADKGLRLLRQQANPAFCCDPTGDGSLRLSGRFISSFNFVDRPWLQVDCTGTRVEAFGCDCPEGRIEGSFCLHCAAVAQAFAAEGVAQAMPSGQDTQEGIRSPGLMDLSYQFANSRYHLYPLEPTPRVPLERFIQVYGDNARARSIYERVGTWGGSCFGFVGSTSMLCQSDSDVDLCDFDPNAQMPSQLALTAYSEKMGMTLHNFIEALQIMQYGNSFWYGYPLKELADGTEAFQKGEGRPVGMAVYSARFSDDGHAVLPYRLERTDGPEDILHIYDPNHPRTTRFGYLEKDATGGYINWRFAMNDYKTYASKTGGQLYLAFYDIYKKAWDNRGGEPKNLLGIKPGMAVVDREGKVLARLTENGPESFCEDIVPLPVMGSGAEDLLMSVPAGAFCVVAEDPALEELKVELLGVNLTVDLSTTAREAEVCVSDETGTVFARIAAEGARYALEILNTLAGNAEKTVLTGTVGQQVLQVAQKDSRLYADGLTEQTALYINGLSAPLTVIGQLEKQETQQIINKPEGPQD